MQKGKKKQLRKMATVTPVDDIKDQPAAKKQKLETDEEAVAVSEPIEAANDASTTKLEQDIIDQVEYYFSDSNLFRDNFLLGEIKKNDGWVSLSTLITFKRLASLTTDLKQIADALDKSDSGLVEINDDRQSIRRHPERPLPEKNEETRKEIMSRTVYVKGFPLDLEIQAIIEFFKEYPKVSHVVIRKYLDKPTKTYKSKGSVFATFSTKDQCAAFLSQDVKYQETELIKKWQTDYYAGKKSEQKEKQKEKAAKQEPPITLPKGAVLFITEIKPDITREVIKEKIEALDGEVAFVDFQKGDERAYVRLSKENSATEILSKLENGKIQLGENESPVSIIEGEDEEKYLAECVEKMKLRRRGGKKPNHKFKHRN